MTVADSVLGTPLTSTVAPAHPASLDYSAPVVSATTETVPAGAARTIWGLDPVQLHTRYWAAHGVQVVRQGEPSEIVKHAELYLLIENDALSLFKLAPLMDALNWVYPQVLVAKHL